MSMSFVVLSLMHINSNHASISLSNLSIVCTDFHGFIKKDEFC